MLTEVSASFCTRETYCLLIGEFGLRYWRKTDVEHPNYQAPVTPMWGPSTSTFRFDPNTNSSSSGSSTASAHTAIDVDAPTDPLDPSAPATPHQTHSIDTFAAAISTVISLQGNLPLDPPQQTPANMSANTTITTSTNPPLNGLKGIAPAVFDGTCSWAENFLNEFWRFRLLNWSSDIINIPFYQVLTALSYIHGPIIKDWVNTQDWWLEGQIDTTKAGHIAETDKVLWTEFEASFKLAWKDNAQAQEPMLQAFS